jgi:hypothetical protein
MSHRARESQTVNNYIQGAWQNWVGYQPHDLLCEGGTGGAGGEGRNLGQGGSGGTGAGPTLNYQINTEHFAMNNQYVGSFCH